MATPFTFVPAVTIFVRHSVGCEHNGDENYRLCRCRKHLRWSHGQQQHRISAKTRSWSEAEKVKRRIESQFGLNVDGTPIAPPDSAVGLESRHTIKRAAEVFVASKRNQGLDENGLKKYERELERLQTFFGARSKFFPHEIELSDLEEFRSGWADIYPSSTTRQKVQERLRAFLRYCYEAKWIERVPKLSAIRVDEPPTLPLTEKEYERLLDKIPYEFHDADKAQKIRALVQLMRHSGLAVRDAVTLERNELQRDAKKGLYRIVTNRQKTGTHVSVPIPDAVAKEVQAVLNSSPRYVFWNSGNGKETTAVTNWQHDLRRLFRSAGFPEGHPHQLRDTFAVDLLQKGVPLEEVSKLLGHESIKTTEKHYAKWVQARQDRLDALVVATWKQGEA